MSDFTEKIHANNLDVKTTSHIYRKKDLLGVGSSCEVYIGLQKSTAQQHALKIFKDSLWARSEERRREVAALRRLKHPNIIKFFGEEEEAGTGRLLLVLELCKEGSLHTYLHEPINSRGLQDHEFLLLIDHLSSALRHLHRHNYVHRDIKPGNILRHVDFDGSCVYKLSDFGACRLIEEEDLFMSLAGTEEYLHPAVYEKAFVDRGAVVFFDSSVDLWSVGCTLYQAVTGQIPFRPHGGARNNRGVMFQMIAQKESGVISGYQTTENGQIAWEKHIPHNSKLSQFLKTDIRNLISHLLEKEQALLMSHDQFYQQVQMILHLIQIVVFNMEDVTYIIIYIKPNCSMAEFQDHLAGKTDIMAGDQLLCHRGRKLTDLTTDGVTVDCLTSDFSEPIILISKIETDCDIKEPKPFDSIPTFQSDCTLEKDCHVIHKMAVVLSDLHERISTHVHLQNSCEKGFSCMMCHLEKVQSYLERSYSNLSTRIMEIRTRFELLLDLESKRVKVTHESNTSITHRCKQARSTIPKLQDQLHKSKTHLIKCKEISKSLINPSDFKLRCSKKCVNKAHNLSIKARDIWRDTYSRKKQQPLSERQQLCHTRDRGIMEDVLTSSLSLYDGHCLPNWRNILCIVRARVEQFHHLEKTLSDVRKNLSEVRHAVDKVEGILVEINAFSGRAWNDVSDQMSSFQNGSIPYGASMYVMKSRDSLDSPEKEMKSTEVAGSLRFLHQTLDNG